MTLYVTQYVRLCTAAILIAYFFDIICSVTQMMMVMVSLIQIREITTDTGIMATDTDADITDVADTTDAALITGKLLNASVLCLNC